MTGLSAEQFDALTTEVAALVDWDAPTGRPHALPLRTALVAVLFVLRHNLPEDVTGELFGCSTATIWRYQEELEPLIDQVLSLLAQQVTTQAHREAVLVDGLVAPVGQREDQEGLYSGKKHYSGYNVQVVANLDARVVDVGDPCPGSRYDSHAFHASGIATRWQAHSQPDGWGMTRDKGYQGTRIITPVKKPPKADPTDPAKAYNRSVSSIRAAVERAIAHLKNWKILKTGYRRALTDFPRILRTVTKLEIYRAFG